MKNKIYPCVWFSTKAREAAQFYASVFPETKIISENNTAIKLEISNQPILLLNSGNHIQLNPAISFMYMTPDADLVDSLWYKMLHGGNIMMEKGAYEWSSNYGWISDKYGVSWQLYSGPQEVFDQTLVPTLMFTQKLNGKAAEAAEFYQSVFPESEEKGLMKNENGEVEHGEFKILNYLMMMMDGGNEHSFGFNEGISMVVECNSQEEINHYWHHLTSRGGEERMCGWLMDRYGISWQIIPENLYLLLQNPGASDAFRKMKKIEIQNLINANSNI